MEVSRSTVLIFKSSWNVSLDMYQGAEVTILVRDLVVLRIQYFMCV